MSGNEIPTPTKAALQRRAREYARLARNFWRNGMRKFWGKTIALAMTALVCGAGAIAQSASKPVKLEADLRDAAKRVFHSKMEFPVTPGPFDAGVSKMDSGGALANRSDRRCDGPALSRKRQRDHWRRDSDDMYAFHCDVPAGVTMLEATLDYLLPAEESAAGVPSASAQLAVLPWNLVVLYPQGRSRMT